MILVSVTLTASLIGCSKGDAENATVENSVAEPKKEKATVSSKPSQSDENANGDKTPPPIR